MYQIFQICLTEVGARTRKTLQIPGCQERCRKTLEFPMYFDYFSEHMYFPARTVLISDNCEPRTETLHSKHIYNSLGFCMIPENCTRTRFWSIFRKCYISNWKRMILQHRFQASRINCRFSSWKIAFSWNQVKMHSKTDSSESLQIIGNSSVFSEWPHLYPRPALVWNCHFSS